MKRRNFIASLLALPIVARLAGTSEAKPISATSVPIGFAPASKALPRFAYYRIPSTGAALDSFGLPTRFCPIHLEQMHLLPGLAVNLRGDCKSIDASFRCYKGDYQETVRFTDGFQFGENYFEPSTEVIERSYSNA